MIERLPELLEEHGVVGAQLAVLKDGEIRCAAAGVLNNDTGEPVTDDSIFEIASITKVWTATLVQELVNEGLLDLDRPVREVLPEFQLADESAAAVITPRQLLSHLAGFSGDEFFDTGTGDDALEKYVALLATAEQVTAPGEIFSYSNTGYVVLGRMVEALRGKEFNSLLRTRFAEPLGLDTVAVLPADSVGREVATGHLRKGDELRPLDGPGWTESTWPAGSALSMSARDVVEFARMHLGTTAFDALREPQVRPPEIGLCCRWGLGWMVFDYDGPRVIGHDGTGVGQRSFLRVVPEAGVAVALLTNGGSAHSLFYEVFSELFGELGVRMPARLTPPPAPVPIDFDRLVGTYRTALYDMHVTRKGDRVNVRREPRTELAATILSSADEEYVGLHEDAVILEKPEDGIHRVLALAGRDEQGRARWLHNGRAAVRQ